MDNDEPKGLKENAFKVGQLLMERYWGPLYKYINQNEQLIKSVPGFLLKPEKLVFYFGKTHLAIEYFGPERLDKLVPDRNRKIELRIFDYTLTDENFFEEIVGFHFDGTSQMELPLPEFLEDLIIPTNKGMERLVELGWNFDAQESMIMLNARSVIIPKGQFSRYVNSLFFDVDQEGLKTRHIKWIDFIPLEYDDSRTEYDKMLVHLEFYNDGLVKHDAEYVYPLPEPQDYKYAKLPQVNRFVELAGKKEISEPEITGFLADGTNIFILSMAFFAKEVHSQIKCEWQSEAEDPIQPDFFIVQPNGYANIVEFKLPFLKSTGVVGRDNRETFSAEINSYISQTRVYKSYFDDPNNRKWIEERFGFKVYNPRRILVIGRRWDFKSSDWKEIIADFRDIEIMTYDDLVDGVVAQFYR